CSHNVFYTGAAVNQQAVPAVEYLMSKEGGGHKKFYLLGSDYVYPRTTNKILRAMLLAKKVPLANIAEEYTPFHHQDYQPIVGEKRVTDDPMEAAYFGVYIWKQAVEKAGKSDVDAVRKAVYGQEFLAPGGKIKMDEANQHTYKPVLIGEILKDGQFKTVSRSKGLVKAEPWSEYTNPDKGCDWINHQGTYQKKK